jgi:peptidoglycan/LPS O-acetylase OafA/YrhL
MTDTSSPSSLAHTHQRRYDLDWLRIIAFGLLIFYHIGMFYVSWGWHVKSVHAGPTTEPFMRLLNPWRLSLLFLISGVALRFAYDKVLNAPPERRLISGAKFTAWRTWRLFLPIMFGIHFIVAPQSWLQLLESGEITKGFWAFYPEYFIGTSERYSVTIPTWNHLWYIVYLMLYTLILAPFAGPLSRFMERTGKRFTHWLFTGRKAMFSLILIPVLPHLIYRGLLGQHFPTTHDVVSDWANHAYSFTYLLTGYVLAKDEHFWAALDRFLKPLCLLVLALGAVLTLTWNNWETVIETPYLWPARFGRILYAWLVIALLLSMAQRYLNKPSQILTYMTEAIFPWYILHQTLTIMIGYWLTRQGTSLGTEFILVTMATFGGCIIIHELFIRRWRFIRPLFGLKSKPVKYKVKSRRLSEPPLE